MIEYHVGKQIAINRDGKTIDGTIVCVYVCPKWDLLDVQTEDGLLQGVSVEEMVDGD